MTLIATTGRAPLRLALAAAVVAALYGAPSAFASTSDSVDNATAAPSAAADSPTAQQPAKLEAMVVTANKRIEKLENVPMSISVMTDAQLQRNNVRELADVINLVPSLTMSYSTTPDNFGINMRGIGTASIGIAVESDVAVIIDDIPYGAQYQAFTDLADVSRIEVLKGPQSTLFGKSAVAGAINITTKPTGGPAGGSASLLYTSDREWRVRASVDASSDKFAFRIAASDTRFPGNVENLTNGQQVNGTGGKTLLGKFTWHALDNLDFEFSPHYNKENDSCCVAVTTSIKPLQGALLNNIAQLPLSTLYAGIPIGTDNHKIRNDFPTSLESTDKGGGLRGIYTFANGATLTGISSFDKYFARDYRDQDFVDAPTLLYYPLANGQPAGVNDGYIQYGIHRVVTHTDELRLTSPDDSTVKYVAGLWYGKNSIDRNIIRGYPGVALTAPVQYLASTYNQNYAVFGQASWEFQPSWTVLGGLRLNREVIGYSYLRGLPPASTSRPDPGVDFHPTIGFSRDGDADNAVTGRVSLQHQFNEDLMAYATYSTGYKGQAYDLTSGLSAVVAAQFPVKPETSRSYEFGVKDNFFDGRATLNVALFNSRFSDYQQSSGVVIPGTATFVTTLFSVPYVQTRGVEADLSILPAEHLLLNAAIAYTDATVGPFVNGPCYGVPNKTTNSGFNDSCVVKNPAFGGANTQDLTGATMPNAPKIRLNVGGQYDIPLPDRPFDAFVTANTRYQSALNLSLSQDPGAHVPGFSITNLGFGVRDHSGKIKLTAFVDNVFNKHYSLANVGVTGTYSSKAPNPVVPVVASTWTPARDAFRYYGLRLDWDFH